MSKYLVLRPGSALGDTIFVSPVPRIFAERGHQVDVACETFTRPIFNNNPYITNFVETPTEEHWSEWEPKFNELVKDYDKVVHAHGHIEVGLMHRTDIKWGRIPNAAQRREIAKGKSYQDTIFEGLGLEDRGILPEFYFTPEEEDSMAKLREILDKDGQKLVLWQLTGSTLSKNLVWGPHYVKETMAKFPNTVHYIYTQEPSHLAQIPNDPRVLDAIGKVSIRESIILTKIADLVIGPESFLVNSAAAFDTPKIIFFSHSSPDNLARYYKNCHSIVPLPEVACSPCYLIQIPFQIIFNPLVRSITRGFEASCRVWDPQFSHRSLGYKCCYFLPHEEVMQAIEEALS
jgi:ADP-heptose:LPS heptosyltransferase